MYDQYNRNIHYMRISITDRCNYRCGYCKGFTPLQHSDICTYEEIIQVCKSAISLGIDTFKITGGEPCARKGYVSFIKQLKQLDGCKSITMTTNGSLLSKTDLNALKDLVDCINVSIDTLDASHYKEITQKDCLDLVLENIRYAKSIGMYIKVNSVLIDDLSNEEILDLIQFGKQLSIPIRFIELMPMKDNHRSHRTKEDVLKLLSNVEMDETKYGNGPASYYKCDEGIIGFIEPVHGKFCDRCNRIRLTSTGFVKACLFHKDGRNIKDGNIDEILKDVLYHKPKAHDFETKMVGMSMQEIGG